MKSKYYLLLCCFFISTSEILAQYTSIPDAKFEERLNTLGYDDIAGDGQVPTATIAGVTSLNLNDIGIVDLTGIESFVALKTLNCRGNELTAVDLSKNVLLETLAVNNNKLTNIDLSNNTKIKNLNLGANQFTAIDVSLLTSLQKLYLQVNSGLTSIDISNNPALKELSTYSTNIENLDLSSHVNLKVLQAYNSPLASIDLTNNSNLQSLRVNDTKIESLDLSKNTVLKALYAQNAQLKYLKIQNGNNLNITTFRVEDNPNLSCAIVDDKSYSASQWTSIPAGLVFSETYCSYTAIPDAKFESALESLGYDDISGDGQVPTVLIADVSDLSLVSLGIEDLTGIRDFVSLKSLNCANNAFKTLDLSNNVLLESLVTKFTPLETLNLSACIKLTTLVCSFNQLSILSVASNTELTYLECNNNNLTSLDLSENTSLLDLRCGANALNQLNVADNRALTSISCGSNMITNLDFSAQSQLNTVLVANNSLVSLDLRNGNNENITNFVASGNTDLTCIKVDDADYSSTHWLGVDSTASFSASYCRYTAIPDSKFEAQLAKLGYDDIEEDGQVPTTLIDSIESLSINGKSITDFTGIQDFVSLVSLDVGNNKAGEIALTTLTKLEFLRVDAMTLTTIDLSNNLLLKDLRCSYNAGIAGVDISKNTLLETAHLGNNGLTSIDLSKNTNLYDLRLSGNSLSSIDVSYNRALKVLVLSNNPLNALSLNANIVLEELYASNCGLTQIEAINSTRLKYLFAYKNSLTSLDFSKSAGSLTNLSVYENKLESLDLAGTTNLLKISASYNNLKHLKLTEATSLQILYLTNNELSSLNLQNGNNNAIHEFNTKNNSALSCIRVDDAATSATRWTNRDSTTSFSSSYCEYTSIPDATFENRLTALGYDDIANDGQVPTQLITEIEYLYIPLSASNPVKNLTGIEDFTALERLVVSGADLSSVDFTKNVNLTEVDLSNNQLTSISVNGLTKLETLELNGNALKTLDVSTNLGLVELEVRGSDLSVLDVTKNELLEILEIDANDITSLDVSANKALKSFTFSSTLIETIDLSNNVNLTYIEAEYADKLMTISLNELTELEEVYFNECAVLERISIKNGTNTMISDFEAEDCPKLRCVLVDDYAYSATNWTTIDSPSVFNETSCNGVQLSLRVWLQGALINPYSGEEAFMRDDLRSNGGSYGTVSPYGDGASISDAVKLGNAGANAMVDWIWIELRNATVPSTTVAGTSAVLQRNGNVVAITDDGITPLHFNIPEGNYYVVVKHRNHLSIMTAAALPLSASTTTVDLTSESSLLLGGTNAVVAMESGVFAMIAGDYDENGQIQNLDSTAVIQQLGVSGYSKADFDMNGQVQNSDINSLMHPNLGKGEQLINSID